MLILRALMYIILFGARYTVVSDQSVLTLSTVTRTDAGTYQCKADNGVGTPQFKKVDLLITCKYLNVQDVFRT